MTGTSQGAANRRVPHASDRVLGQRLAALRREHGIKGTAAAAALAINSSTLSRIEHGTCPLTEATVRALLDLYTVTGPARDAILTDTLTVLCAASGDGAAVYAFDRATHIRIWAPAVLPRILHTRAYAAAIAAAHKPITRTLTRTLSRDLDTLAAEQQHLLTSGATLDVIADEAALTRRFGGTATMTAQLTHLAALAAAPAITIKVMPLLDGHGPRAVPAFTHLTYPPAGDYQMPAAVQLDRLPGELAWRLDKDEDVYPYELAFRELWNAAVPAARYLPGPALTAGPADAPAPAPATPRHHEDHICRAVPAPPAPAACPRTPGNNTTAPPCATPGPRPGTAPPSSTAAPLSSPLLPSGKGASEPHHPAQDPAPRPATWLP